MAEAFCISAASNAVGTLMVKPVDHLLELVKRPLRYVFHFNTIVEELQKQKKNLTKEQTRVQEDVRQATRHIQTLEIEEDVEKWLTDAENVLKEAESLEQRIGENKRCFRWCPNWSWRYELSKKIEQTTLAIKELVESSNFERVGHRAALPSIEFLSSKDLIASKSSTSASNQIMEALRSDEVNMIGVWGMGGVGKTTLVTEVGHKVKDFQLFHRVMKVVVSQPPDVGKIQDIIRDSLEFKFESTTQEGKARELWAKLKKEEKVLIILDDLWNKLNLQKIGIPVGENHKGCTIILTTRRRQVCEDMESQVTVPLGVLDEDEAWTLFKMKAGLDNASPNIIGVAKDVAKECGGLPIAIVTLARVLKSRDLNGWELARHKLERSRYMDIERVPKEDQNAYLCLETSYNYLKRETKRCFLLCALYPEDCSIDVEDLVRYAWALRLYEEAGSIKEVRREVYEAINNLKDSCLLLEGDDDERNIKLHDVVRDVALWIASKEDNGLVTKSGVASENESSKQKLEILLLDEYDSKTPIEGFEGMPELKVLSVRKRASKSYNDHNSVFSLNALESLTNLRALHLEGFEQLEGISALAKLTRLEILSLHGFEFHESIDNLGELQNLRVLDMCHCHFLLGVRPSLIRRLVKVEELYLFGSTIKRLVHGAFLLELNLLPTLASLFLKVSSQNFPKYFVFPKLERYNILINTDELTDGNEIPPNSLMISKELRLNVISELVWNVENLLVSEVKVKDIKFLTDTTPGNVSVATILQNLKCVGIGDCENLEVIFYMKKVENQALLLSNLKWLVLWGLPNLEYIWEMPTQHISLRSLEVVKIEGCGQLKSLLSFSLAQSLECLRKLKIDGCGELKQIVGESEGDEQEISTNMNLNKPLCLPKLKSLKIKNCGSLEYIFPNFMAPEGLPQLQKLSLVFLSQLKQICRPTKQREENGILLPQLQLLPSLTDLTLHDCPDLTDAAIHSEPTQASLRDVQLSQLIQTGFVVNAKKFYLGGIGDSNLIPEVYPEGLNELSVLELHSCKSLEYLVDTTKEHVPNSAFSNLVELSLGQMGGLKTLCNGQFPKGFLQNLKKLTVEECGQLRDVFQIDEENQAQLQLLSNLEHLELKRLPELRWILKGPAHFFSLRSLKVVKICNCKRLKSVFSPSLIQSLLQLEELLIENCDELRTLLTELESDGETESNSHLHPLCLPKLTVLRIYGCPRLEYVLPITLTQGLPQLETLKVKGCDELKTVFIEQESDGETESNSHQDPLCLPRLTTLKISKCQRLEYVLPISLAQGLPQLEELKVKGCDELKTVFTKQESDGETESNSHLHPLCLPRLTTLMIYNCLRLEYVLPINLAQGLPQLEKLEIDGRERDEWGMVIGSKSNLHSQLKQVFGVAKQHDGVEHWIQLPSLKHLQLYYSTNLSSFGPENYFFKAPALEELCVCACPQLIKFTIQQEVNSWVDLQVMNYYKGVRLSAFKELLRNANNLSLKRIMDLQKNLIPNVDVDLQGLTSLSLEDCEDLECLANTADEEHVPTSEVFTNLVELFMKNMIGLKVLWKGTPSMGFLQNLKSLRVESCEKLEEIFGIDELKCNTEQNQPPLLSNLHYLDIESAPELRWIVKGPTQYVSLRSLRYVSIEKCNKLESLFSSSLTGSLRLLEKLRITYCVKLETIFTEVETESYTICVPNLKTLEITNCPTLEYVLANLSSVTDCPENCFIRAPALEDLRVAGCPRLSNFTFQQHKQLQPKDFEECIDEAELCNNQLRERSPNMICFDQLFLPSTGDNFMSNLEAVRLSDLYWLRYIWKAPTQVVVTNLRQLDVYNCNRLTYVFPVMLVRNLRKLWSLKIRCCEKLEQIVLNDDTSASSSQGHDEDETGVKNKKEMLIFPQLKYLSLKELPSLLSFSPVGYHLIFPSLVSLEIGGCSQMITSFTTDSIQSVHATEVMNYYEFLRNANVDVDLQGLTSLSLEDCEGLECLANAADEEHVPTSEVFTNLVELRMKNMIGLKVLWNGQPPRGFLQNLKSLRVERCEKLEEIFGIDELLCNTEQNQPPPLSKLDSLEIESAPELRWIVKGPTQYVNLRRLRDVSIKKCNKLESLFSSSLIPSLSPLENLRIDQCDELKTVFTEDETESNTLCMPNLKYLSITDCPTLKYVLVIACALDLPRLQMLRLIGLTNLSSVTDCPENCFIKAPALNDLEVSGCPRLSNFTFQQHKPRQSKDFEECIDEAELCNNQLRERSPYMICFDQLFLPSTRDNFMSHLAVGDLDWLRYIWKAPTQVVVTHLQSLDIYNCNTLTCVFPAMLARNLRVLGTLKIRCCEKLEQIIVNDDTSASSSQGHDEGEMGAKNKKEMLIVPELRSLFLEELPSLLRFSLVGYHLIFPSLESLEIRGCSQMITSFTVDSKQSVHATEAPRLDDATPSIRDICWRRNSAEEDASLPPYMEEAEEI